jgi:hypothetical protein
MAESFTNHCLRREDAANYRVPMNARAATRSFIDKCWGEAMSLDRTKAPPLRHENPPTSTSKAHTLFLEINLEVPPGNGQPVQPVPAVFCPDPSQLPASEVNMILWLHGDKKVWSKKRGAPTLDMSGTNVRDYLQVDEVKLREFILQTSQKKFLLVIPTLADRSSAEGHTKTEKIPAGGLLGTQDGAEAYLDVVLKGVNAYMGKHLDPPRDLSLTRPKNIVLAAHSGGGYILSNMAAYGGLFAKQVQEIWCFDCTYWGNIINWAKKGHATRKLFVYSTGEGYGSRPNPDFDPTLPEGPKNPKYQRSGTGDTALSIYHLTKADPAPSTTIDVLIEAYSGSLVTEQSTPNFKSSYGIPDGRKHYECIEKFLPKLVEKSENLK